MEAFPDGLSSFEPSKAKYIKKLSQETNKAVSKKVQELPELKDFRLEIAANARAFQ